MYCKLKKDGASYFNEAQGLICKKKDLAAGIFTYDWTKSWFIKSLRALVQTLHGEGVRPHLMRSIRPRRPRLNQTPCELLRRHSHTITDLRFSFYEAWTAFIPPILDGRLGLILSNPHRASNLTHPLVIERLAIIPNLSWGVVAPRGKHGGALAGVRHPSAPVHQPLLWPALHKEEDKPNWIEATYRWTNGWPGLPTS